MKKKLIDLSEEEKVRTLDTLYTAASAIKGRTSIKLFLKDLLTPSERIMLGRRIIIARMLIHGESHRTIETRLGVGRSTVERVRRWLKDQFPGFENAIREMEIEFDKRAKGKMANVSLIGKLKKKYPLHFLLFPNPKSR